MAGGSEQTSPLGHKANASSGELSGAGSLLVVFQKINELTELLAELTHFAAELSEFSLSQQCSRNSILPVPYLGLP